MKARRHRCSCLIGKTYASLRRCRRWAGAGSAWCTQHRKKLIAGVCSDLLEGRYRLERIDSKE